MENNGRKGGKTILKRKIFINFLLVSLLLSVFTSSLIDVIPIVKIVGAGDITSDVDSDTFLTLSIYGDEEPPEEPPEDPPEEPPALRIKPKINWYDFQTLAGVSKLNSQINVNQKYKFCINISSDQGWDDIEYIDIAAWFDNGDDSMTYNNSGNLGGNLNMFLRYENTTGTANYVMLWPDDEVVRGVVTETVVSDPNGSPGFTECHNLTFSFMPRHQFRYAPGDDSWDDTKNAINDVWSWNFKISVIDSGENATSATTSYVKDEFGVYPYTEVVSAGMLTIWGAPGENATAVSNVTINTRSNIDYSLSVDIETLIHKTYSTAHIPNQTIWVRGGDLETFTNFTGSKPIYFYGSASTYHLAGIDGTSKKTSDVEYKCNIPFGQKAGDYRSTIHYYLRTPT